MKGFIGSKIHRFKDVVFIWVDMSYSDAGHYINVEIKIL